MLKTKIAVVVLLIALISAGCTPRNPQGGDSERNPREEQDNDSRGEDNPNDESNLRDTEPSREDSRGDSTEEDNNEEDTGNEDDKDSEGEEANLEEGRGKIKMGDSGYQVTVAPPFKAKWNADMGSLFITVPDDVSFQGAFFHDSSDQGVQQLETTVKNMEASYKNNPTITDFKQEVDEGENGLFSFTFTYSAGEAEGSPAGFYYVHYQKTPTGLLTGNFSCPKVNYANSVKKMFDSIVPETEESVKAPTA